MASFSFFGKPPHMGRNHMQRLSTLIRGIQMAEHLGGRFNPADGYENDVCIYVKTYPDWIHDTGRTYIDVVDGWTLFPFLSRHPEYPLIACSQTDHAKLVARFPKSEVTLIPQHHCNFERQRRSWMEIRTVGALGGTHEFPPGLREGLQERGIEFVECTQFRTRKDVVNFFTGIDVQIVWRPWIVRNRLSNPLKIVNAASFGVPTIALYEPTFDEMDGAYMPVNSLDSFMDCLDSLRKSPDLYAHYSGYGMERAEYYHIENIGRLYESL
jgi:hypothetical protein